MALAALAAATPVDDGQVLAQVTRDLCGKRVALLGEAGNHGDGETLAFKARLVRRLVTRCGYRAVMFEAGIYDFVELDRRWRAGEPTDVAMLSAAIGGLWRSDREVADLMPFLLARAQGGRLFVGGFDDNLGAAGSFWSLDAMPDGLVALLPAAERASCRETLRRLIYADHGTGGPGPAARLATLRCVAAMRAGVGRAPVGRRAALAQLLVNIRGVAAAMLSPPDARIAARERAMVRNVAWLRGRLPPRTKVILWGATVHMARERDALAAGGGRPTLGGYVHRQEGRGAFSLGFAAQGGSVRVNRRGPPEPVPVPPPGSLEADALPPGADIAYLRRPVLARLGRRPAAILTHRYQPVDAAALLDGLVVFRRERPPTPIVW